MKKPVSPEEFGAIIETMIETQALLASSIYVDLVNSGLIEDRCRGPAAQRARRYRRQPASPASRDRGSAWEIASRAMPTASSARTAAARVPRFSFAW
jgi:hypothetical protein